MVCPLNLPLVGGGLVGPDVTGSSRAMFGKGRFPAVVPTPPGETPRLAALPGCRALGLRQLTATGAAPLVARSPHPRAGRTSTDTPPGASRSGVYGASKVVSWPRRRRGVYARAGTGP